MTSQASSQFINDDFVEQLLDSSGPVNVIQAGELLYRSLRQLRKSEQPAAKKFALFQQLTPAALHLINGIATVIEQQSSKKRNKTLQLCLQLSRNLCLGFYGLHQAQELSDEQKKTAIYLALQMAGQDIALRYRFQTPVSISLWILSAKLYFFAVKHQYLTDTLAIKLPEFLPLKSIDAVIKRNLLFTLSTTDLVDASDWEHLFNFAAHHTNLIQLTSHLQTAVFFYWNTVASFPTQIKNPQQVFSPHDILISDQALVDAILNDRIHLNLVETKRKKLFHQLTGFQKLINDAHPAPPIIFNVSIGFENCFHYLINRQKLTKIQQLSGQPGLDVSPSRPADDNFYNLSLSPLDSERGFVDPNEAADLSDNHKQLSRQNLIPVKFQEASDANFFMFEGKNLSVNNGDLVILVNNRNALLAGIIRQQKELPNFGMQRILIEKIHGELSAHPYQQADGETQPGNAIILNESTNQAEIFLSDRSLKPGADIILSHQAAQLGNLIEYTAEWFRFQLMFPD